MVLRAGFRRTSGLKVRWCHHLRPDRRPRPDGGRRPQPAARSPPQAARGRRPPIDGARTCRYRTFCWRATGHTGILRPAGVMGGIVKQSIITASLILGVASLSACSSSVDCSGGNYRGGCYPGTPISAASPAAASPAAASPAAASPAVSRPAVTSPSAAAPATGAATVGRGEPSDFAAVDDKQCRSYGLKFGTRDYADCRIRLSAQHRGLDPNIGAPRRVKEADSDCPVGLFHPEATVRTANGSRRGAAERPPLAGRP